MKRKELTKLAELIGSIIESELQSYCRKNKIKYNKKLVAELIGINRTTLCDILKGKHNSIDIFHIKMICEFLGKPGGFIIDHPDVNELFQVYLANNPNEEK